VVRGHVRLTAGTELSPIREVHIINYADKRVRHDTVVPLEDRFVDLVERYGHTPERRARLEKMKQTAQQLERNIFSRIDETPEDLHGGSAGPERAVPLRSSTRIGSKDQRPQKG
jgi:hypothetical protein